MTLHHLGALHPAEQWLTLALAFGPFLVLAGVIRWRRRHDTAAADIDGDTGGEGDIGGDAGAARQPGPDADRTR